MEAGENWQARRRGLFEADLILRQAPGLGGRTAREGPAELVGGTQQGAHQPDREEAARKLQGDPDHDRRLHGGEQADVPVVDQVLEVLLHEKGQRRNPRQPPRRERLGPGLAERGDGPLHEHDGCGSQEERQGGMRVLEVVASRLQEEPVTSVVGIEDACDKRVPDGLAH